ncbi:hypothetical protein BDY19DRAFT_998708 [Irpex rosettiformis]|uniref:Uncharacterized protein n=1 Tax=Irpex rosettiformis TaxID=378272 RepID=A0ACB8TMQ4_9APHY|nr:hypothetical protein BDY19DRAFT_998708 [Irpex rosettiformis]
MDSRWTDKVTLLKGSDGDYKLTFQDALAACPTPDGKYLITSPNMSYIPMPVWGRLDVSMKADGKFGMEDPLQWPQAYIASSRWKSLMCIPRASHPRRRCDLWHVPTVHLLRSFVEELNRDVESFESSKGPNSHLRWLQLTMTNTLDCLEAPSTERDIIRQLAALERFCCMLIAWLTWDSAFSNLSAVSVIPIVHADLMGCFTTSLSVVGELYHAGIPVWHMRLISTVTPSIHVVSCPPLSPPESLVTDSGNFGSRPVYQGPPGQAQIEAIIFCGSQYIDIEQLPFPEGYSDRNAASNIGLAAVSLLGLPASSSSQAGPSRTASSSRTKKEKQKKKKQQANPHYRPALPKTDPTVSQKFNDPPNPCIPPLLNGWLPALQDGVSELQPTRSSWSLWVPEPHLVTGSPSLLRRQRFVLNWLKIREAWWQLVRNPNTRTSMMSRWWWAYLDDGFDNSAAVHGSHESARQKAIEVLTKTFSGTQFDPADLRPTWFGQPVATVDGALCRQISWEISEMGFRLELMLLDLALLRIDRPSHAAAAERDQWLSQIFPGGNPLLIISFPATDAGLSSPILLERGKSLEGLRRLMLAWPDCPEPLKASQPLSHVSKSVLASLEPMLKSFYVRSFVKVANRPPILPRQRPASSLPFSPMSPQLSPQSPPLPVSPLPTLMSPLPIPCLPFPSSPSFALPSQLPQPSEPHHTYTPPPPTPRLCSQSPPLY